MGPKKNRKRQDDDQIFEKKQKQMAQMLKKVEKIPLAEEQMSKEKKTFDYDTYNKKLLYVQEEKEKPSQKPVIKLTAKEQEELNKKLEKQKVQKEKKERKKQQKKDQRQKEMEQQRQIQVKKKQELQKQAQQVQKQVNRPKVSGKTLPIFFLCFIICLSALQYQKELYTRLSKFQLQGQENFYDTLEIHSGATNKQLKEKYKRLVLKYHPDKNTNCQNCEEKFNKIIAAWQVLGNPEKREHYDSNSGFVTQIKSSSITLTPENYERLVLDNPSLWIIQVYDSTQKYCHFFSQFWEDIVNQYGKYIKFGRVDVWTQTDMMSYLPYRFQIFPSIYYVHKGQIQLCTIDFQNPDSGLRRCIESQYKQNIVKSIKSIDEIKQKQSEQESDVSSKLTIVLNSKTKISPRLKIINKKYEEFFNFYWLDGGTQDKNLKQQVQCLGNYKNGTWHYSSQFKVSNRHTQFYQRYQKFLQSQFYQKVSLCDFIETCEDQSCYVLLKPKSTDYPQLPVQDSSDAKPVYEIQDEQFYKSVQSLKNKTGVLESFQIGLYQNGHIDMGYMDESDILNVEQGQNFQELVCIPKDNSWTGRIVALYSWMASLMQ